MNPKALLIAAAIMAALSCEKVDYKPHPNDDIAEPEQRGDLYYCAVEYEPDYNWRKDIMGGMVDCSLVLYKEHEAITRVSLPADEYQSADCELHNIYNGSLYSVHYIGDKTVIKQNGISIMEFEYDGPIESFLVNQGIVHSISITPGGKGWRYRKGIDIIAESSNGYLMGNMYTDKDQVCFAYAERLVSSGSASACRYYFVADGSSELIPLLPTVTEVLAVMRVDGSLNILEREANIKWPVWVRNGASMITSVDSGTDMRDFWFCVMGDEVYAHAQAKTGKNSTTEWNDCFWTWGSLDYKTLAKKQVVAVCPDRKEMCYVASDNALSGGLEVTHGGKTVALDDAYIMPSPYSLCCSHAGVVIGLNDSSKNNRPIIVDGADTIEMDFNGYFTHFRLP